MPDLTPRKQPRQERSRVTVEAILEAGARILREQGYAALTTNRLAERAGVSIGSLYNFFPNREAILLAMLQRRLLSLAGEIDADLRKSLQQGGPESMQYLIGRLVAVVSADRELFRVLLRELPMLREREEVQRALESVFDVGRHGAQRAAAQLDMPEPDVDVWLVIQMVGGAVLEICFAPVDEGERQRLVRSLARLTYRMTRRT